VDLIEVGPALSIALGRLRPAVSCGGCSDPLTFEGVPARTVPGPARSPPLSAGVRRSGL